MLRQPVQLGPAAWNAILPPQGAPHTLEGDATADFVVVGAGFAGLAAARRLTQLQPGARIILVDAGRIAEGAAGRNSGFMIDLPHELTSQDYAGEGDDKSLIALNRQAQKFARDAVDKYRIPAEFFVQAGKVNGAASDRTHARNLSYAKHLAALGEPSELLDAQQMSELTGSGHYRSGLFTPGTVMLQPAGYVRGFAKGLRDDGVAILENSPIMSFVRDGEYWSLTNPQGRVRARKVILTVNGHLESFGFERGRLMHVFLFACMTPNLNSVAPGVLAGAPRWGVTPSDPMGTTVRRIDTPQGGDRIITRTCATYAPDMTPGAASLKRASRIMQRKFDQRFSELAGLSMEYRWAGHLCLSRNGVSVMREVEDGIFSGCVQNGLGTARGTLTGIGAAELACGENSAITRYFSTQDRPDSLPAQPLQQFGANAVLRWKEWRAQGE